MKSTIVLSVLTSLVLSAASADDNTFIWTNTAKQRCGLVENTADWQGGARPTTDHKSSAAQTNDTFVFSSNTSWEQTVFATSASQHNPYYMGTITGSFSHYLTCVATYNFRFSTVKDASEFEGTLGADTPGNPGSGGWILLSTLNKPTHVKNFRAMGAPTVAVGEYNATGVLDHVSGYGFMRAPHIQGDTYTEKTSSKGWYRTNTVVEVGAVEGGSKLSVHVSQGGTLLVHGSKLGTASVVGNPAFHLDANVPSSMTFDGGRLVRWADVDGRPFAAVKDGDNLAPTVEGDDYVDLDMVNFGAMRERSDQVPHCGNSSTLVFEGGAIENIREVFIVFRDQPVYQRPVPGEGSELPGKRWNWQLNQNFLGCAKDEPQYFARLTQRRGGTGWYFSWLLDNGTQSGGNYTRDYNPASAHLNGADIRLDGAFALAQTAGEFDHEPHVLSIGLRTDVAKADRFACNGNGSLGGIRLGEVIVYTNALSLAQRREVNAYLMAKWHPEKPNDLDFKWVREDSGSHLKAADGTLKVGQYEAGSTAITMEGNLDVTTLKGENRALVFSNGASNLTLRTDAFAAGITVPTKPSGTPDVWLDANKGITTFSTNVHDYGETTYVNGWVDARDGTNSYGYAVTTHRQGASDRRAGYLTLDAVTGQVLTNGNSYCCWPTMKDVGSLKMVDFGPQHQEAISRKYDGTGKQYVDPVTGDVYEGVKTLYGFTWQKARDGSALAYSISKTGSSPIMSYSITTAFWVMQINEDTVTNATTSAAVTPYAFTAPGRNMAFGYNRKLADQSSTLSEFADAEWYVNGERADPNSYQLEKGKTYVVGVRLQAPCSQATQNLAYYPSGSGSGSWGGVSYGEFLTYTYALPDRDYLETEAYLMKRWLDQDHPAVTRATQKVSLSSLSYADAAAPSVDNDRDLNAGTLDTGAADSFVKRGAGKLTVAAKAAVKNYTAEAGTLETSVDWLEDAALRLDASNYASFTWKAGQEGTSVATWKDSRNNGRYVTSVTEAIRDPKEWLSQPGLRITNTTSGMTNAQYRVSDGTDGLKAGVPYVDCLEQKNSIYFDSTTREWLPKQESGCSYMLGASNNCAGLQLSQALRHNLREYHVVYADNGGHIAVNSANLDLYGQVPGDGQGRYFYWNGQAGGSGYNASQASRRWDDAITWNRDNSWPKIGKTFHVFSFASAEPVDMDYIGMDRGNCGRGGIKICELICFTDKTNTTERANAIHDYLMTKWRAIGEAGAPAVALDSVRAEKGATLTINTDGAPVTVSALTGLGTFDVAGGLTLAAARYDLAVSFVTPTMCDMVTAVGALTLPSVGTVTLTTAAGVKPTKGFYPIISATTLTADISGWTLDATGANPLRNYKLVRRGNQIGIDVIAQGFMMLVR